MKKTHILIFISLVIAVCITACKKATSICQDHIVSISTVNTQGATHTIGTQIFQFDSSTGHYTNTIYSHDSIITYGGIYVYLLDASGRPTREDDIDGTHYTFSYMPDGTLAQTLYYLAGQPNPVTTDINTWQGGNIAQTESINASNTDTSFSYYTYYSYSYQDLNPFDVPLGKQTANLVKQIISVGANFPPAGDTAFFTYQFDAKGRVSSYTEVDRDTTSVTYTLTYKCN